MKAQKITQTEVPRKEEPTLRQLDKARWASSSRLRGDLDEGIAAALIEELKGCAGAYKNVSKVLAEGG